MEVNWSDGMSACELTAIKHAESYAIHFQGASIPGHTHVLLIAKLASICDDLQSRIEDPNEKIIIKKVFFDTFSSLWRDVETGVIVEVP